MKDYDNDLIWRKNFNYPRQIDLKHVKDNTELSSVYHYGSHNWNIACTDKVDSFSHLFKDHDNFLKERKDRVTYESKIDAMKVVMYRINKYIKKFNSEGITQKVYYVNIHQNEHIEYATQEFFSFK